MKVNLGGNYPIEEGWVNVDNYAHGKGIIRHDLNHLPWPFEEGSVEEIKCTYVIEHLNLPLTDFLKECKRILKHKGKLHLVTDNVGYWRDRINFLLGNWHKMRSYHPFHTYLYDYNTFVKICAINGFTCAKEKRNTIFQKISPQLFCSDIDVVLFNNSDR